MAPAPALTGAAAAVQALLALVVGVRYGNSGAASIVAALVLGPLAVLGTARIAARIAGTTLAAGAAWTFVLLPLVSTGSFQSGYRHTWLHEVLPQLVGARATWWYALGAALAIGVSFVPARAAALAGATAALTALFVYGTGALGGVEIGIHETGWSVSLTEWLPIAGAIGVARRAPLLAVALGGWLVFFALRAAEQGYEGGAFWASLAPALPAAALLVSSLALLVPRLRPAAAPQQAPTAR
ncbi:MAG: hypothetical protein ACJ757_11805 [Gaiellaceae bacterium]